jgi:hypothetical protein
LPYDKESKKWRELLCKLTHEEGQCMLFIVNLIIIIIISKCCSEMTGTAVSNELINISNNDFLIRTLRNQRHLDLLSKNEAAILKF